MINQMSIINFQVASERSEMGVDNSSKQDGKKLYLFWPKAINDEARNVSTIMWTVKGWQFQICNIFVNFLVNALGL